MPAPTLKSVEKNRQYFLGKPHIVKTKSRKLLHRTILNEFSNFVLWTFLAMILSRTFCPTMG